MNPTRILFKLLPVIGVLVDFTLGYPALTWIVESLPLTFIPMGLLILLTSVIIVTIELLFGASDERILKYVGYAIVSIIPLFSIAEGFNKYTESILLEMPQSDVYRILITQGALVILASCVHILIIVKAKYILSLYSVSIEELEDISVEEPEDNYEVIDLKEQLEELDIQDTNANVETDFEASSNGIQA